MNKFQFLLASELLILALVNLFKPAQLGKAADLLTTCRLVISDKKAAQKLDELEIDRYIDNLDQLLEQILPQNKTKIDSALNGFLESDEDGVLADSAALFEKPLVKPSIKRVKELTDKICGTDDVCQQIKICCKR